MARYVFSHLIKGEYVAMTNSKSLLLATAAAALFTSGQLVAAEKGKASEGKVHCGGVNACKGTTECKTASNSCKGLNACAGQGFVILGKKECDAKGGRVLKK
jgi:hypothetical protein